MVTNRRRRYFSIPFHKGSSLGFLSNFEEKGRKTPLVLLHGGPGGSLNGLNPLIDGLEEMGWPFLAYHQYGGTANPAPEEDEGIYTASLWVEELINLRKTFGLDEVSLFGTSWGGMLAIIYLCDYAPKGIKSVILDSTLASASLWRKECMEIVHARLSKEDREAIEEGERIGDYRSRAYLKAMANYLRAAVNPNYTLPTDINDTTFANPAYMHAWGPSEFCPLGTLKDYEYLDKVGRISCPILITSGEFDESTPKQNEALSNALTCPKKWVLFKGGYHGSYREPDYIETLEGFLRANATNLAKRSRPKP